MTRGAEREKGPHDMRAGNPARQAAEDKSSARGRRMASAGHSPRQPGGHFQLGEGRRRQHRETQTALRDDYRRSKTVDSLQGGMVLSKKYPQRDLYQGTT